MAVGEEVSAVKACFDIGALPGVEDGELRLSGPDASGVIHVSGSGRWTKARSDTHSRELRALVEDCRARGLDIRVLCDLRAMAVDCADLLEHSGRSSRKIYRPKDRIAILVKTSLAKMQLRRGDSIGNVEMFLSTDAAKTWLNAYV